MKPIELTCDCGEVFTAQEGSDRAADRKCGLCYAGARRVPWTKEEREAQRLEVEARRERNRK